MMRCSAVTRWVVATIGMISGCGPASPSTAGGNNGAGTNAAETSGVTTTSTTGGAAAATSTTASSTGVDLECPDENVFDGDLEMRTGDDPMALFGLTEITGRLTISSDDIVDLSFLSCLRAVDQLVVKESQMLRSFEGLEQLTRVLGLVVFENPELESLRGLDALREVGSLSLHQNPSMTTIGLDDLEHAIQIRIGGCSGVEAVGGPGLADVVGLSGLRGEVHNVHIEGNEDLVSLEGLRQWADNGVTISSVLLIRHNRQLPTEHAEEIFDLFGAGWVCGNQGDDGPWDSACECNVTPPP